MSSRSYLFIGLATGMILVIAIGMTVSAKPYQIQGSVIQTPIPAADFHLIDQNGKPFQLSGLHGKFVLMFFGYTYCKDVCPQTLAQFRRIEEQLGDQSGQVDFVFITVDPERDTPERIKAYMNGFDPRFIGLTGDSSILEGVWKAYGIYVAKGENSNSSDYEVEHTGRIFLIDQTGNLKLTYPSGFETEKIVQDLQYLIKARSNE